MNRFATIGLALSGLLLAGCGGADATSNDGGGSKAAAANPSQGAPEQGGAVQNEPQLTLTYFNLQG